MSVEPAQTSEPGQDSVAAGSGDAASPGTVPAELRDGYEVHQSLLRHGLDVVLYPRQVMMASTAAGELSFVHGIPETSTLSAVTYAQDKRMRRAQLERAGVPVPKGATFSVGRGIKEAKAFARRVGYPVVVKPAMGDNAIEAFADVADEEQLDAAIDYLRTPPTERDTFVRSAYALTELREPGEEEGRIVVPPGYRFLVEQQVTGSYVRLLVIGREVRSAVRLPVPPGVMAPLEPGEDVFAELHPTVAELAVRAVSGIPGLTVASVDLVVSDFRRSVDDQHAWVVEFGERPGLVAQATVSDRLSQQAGDMIVRHYAESRAVALPEPGGQVAMDVHAAAIPDLDGAIEVIAARARAAGLTGELGVTDRVEGVADGVIQGPPEHVAWLSELLLAGMLDGHGAMLVEERHREPEPRESFTIRS